MSVATRGLVCRFEPYRPQWWNPERRGERQPVPGLLDRLDPAQIPDPASGILVRVGVEHLLPAPAVRQPEPVALVRRPAEVGHTGDRRSVLGVAQEGEGVA